MDLNRRAFLRDSIAAVATAGFAGACTRPIATPIATPSPVAVDPNDRSSTRHAWAVQRSTLVVNGLDPSLLRVEYLQMLRDGGVDCWHRGGGNFAEFAATRAFCDQHADTIVYASSVRDIRRARQQSKIAHISGWQSASTLVVDGRPQVDSLQAYHALGLRIVGLVYNTSNAFGGGCIGTDAGLTDAGRRLVEQIHKHRILLDVGGHTGEQTSFDALAMSSGVPVVCTHTNIRALNDNPRCSTDKLLETIAKTGGVIGLTAFNDFHARTRRDVNVKRTPQVGLDRHLDQYDYLKRLVGVDHIGIGPDFIDGPGRNDPGVSNQSSQTAEAYSERPWYYVKGFENISELPNVTQGLIQRGWSTAEIHKVLGGNWLRVYEMVWGA